MIDPMRHWIRNNYLHAATDTVLLLLVVDKYDPDVQSVYLSRQIVKIAPVTMRDPHSQRLDGHKLVGMFARWFRACAVQSAASNFEISLKPYLNVALIAPFHDGDRHRSIKNYEGCCHETSGTQPLVAKFLVSNLNWVEELFLPGIALKREVVDNYKAPCDQGPAVGDDNDFLAFTMHQPNIDFDVTTTAEIDGQIIRGLTTWTRADYYWILDGDCHCASNGLEYGQTCSVNNTPSVRKSHVSRERHGSCVVVSQLIDSDMAESFAPNAGGPGRLIIFCHVRGSVVWRLQSFYLPDPPKKTGITFADMDGLGLLDNIKRPVRVKPRVVGTNFLSDMSFSIPAPKDLPAVLYLPDTMANWPWPRAINPHYKVVGAASRAWFHSFNALSPQSQKAFDKCNFALLSSLAYPWVSEDHLRTGCDLMHVFFLVDEYTDVEHADVVREMVDVVLDAMRHPYTPRPVGEVVLGEIARQFWARALKTASATSQKHMIESITDFLESIVDQAVDRDEDRYRTVEEYLQRRRKNVGTRPSCVPLELGLNLTDDIFYHRSIVELADYIVEIIIVDNDIASYNREQAMGDDRYNLLAVAMRQFDTDFDGAMAWVVQYHVHLEAGFMDALKRVPSFGSDKDRPLWAYIRGLANWPRCNDCWNFEGTRYFGDKGSEYKRTRMVPLLPKITKSDKTARKEEVVIPLVEQLEAKCTL